jgi:uncharacterized protein
MATIGTVEELEAIYGAPGEASTVKELDHVSAGYRAYIEASPFMVLATVGPEGLDCSPRGDLAPVVRVVDPRTLVLPDRRGNNRVDSLRNIVRDPRVGFLFVVPGSGTCLRANGLARVVTDEDLLESFAVEGKRPRSCVVMKTEAVYFQCARAIVRSGLWDPARFVDPSTLPTPGDILAAVSEGRVGGEAYDREWPGRAAKTLW